MTAVLLVAVVWLLAATPIALLIGRVLRAADRRAARDNVTWRAASGDLPITLPVTGPGDVTWDGNELRWTAAPASPAELAHVYAADPDGPEAHCRREILDGRMTPNTLRRARALAATISGPR